MTPYYQDDSVTLYHGDCREVSEWLTADVLVTDPPYGTAWRQDQHPGAKGAMRHAGIVSDGDPAARDASMASWGSKPALVFGDIRVAAPAHCRGVLVFHKPTTSRPPIGRRLPWHNNWEPVYVCGNWPPEQPTLDAVVSTRCLTASGYSGYATRAGHPHAKPLDVLEELITACPPGVVADPFAGSGSTLVAAKQLGRRAIGVEIDERYCELAARRLTQDILFGGVES